MMRLGLVLLVVATLGCGIGRSKLIGPKPASPDAAIVPQQPDGNLPPADGLRKDTFLPTGDVVSFPEVVTFPPDLPSLVDLIPPFPPDVPGDPRPSDRPPEALVLFPDVPPFVTPDLPPEVPFPINFDLPPERPDGPPVSTPDVSPDLIPPQPDLGVDRVRTRPDAFPPGGDCTAGAACTSDCTVGCNTIGSQTCTCSSGVLTCGDCQIPPITISQLPCPDNPTGTDCAQTGLACLAFGNGAISGVCVCVARGADGTPRWACILR